MARYSLRKSIRMERVEVTERWLRMCFRAAVRMKKDHVVIFTGRCILLSFTLITKVVKRDEIFTISNHTFILLRADLGLSYELHHVFPLSSRNIGRRKCCVRIGIAPSRCLNHFLPLCRSFIRIITSVAHFDIRSHLHFRFFTIREIVNVLEADLLVAHPKHLFGSTTSLSAK